MSNRPTLQHRVPLLVTASLAVLGLAASPAFAGSDGDQPPAIEQPPAPPAPTPLPLPQPAPKVAPAPAPPASAPAPSRSVKGERTEKKSHPTKTAERPVVFVRRTTTTRAVRATTASTFPTGGVQAGAGGTSLEPATPAAAIGLGGASLVLLLASGGVAAARRR